MGPTRARWSLLLVALVVLVVVVLGGCSKEPSSDAQLRKRLEGLQGTPSDALDPRRSDTVVMVATTLPVLGDLVRNVGGTNVRVTDIVKAGLDPHDYEPTDADADVLAKAQLVIRIDRGIDPWFPALAAKAKTAAKVVDAAAAVPAKTLLDGTTPDPYVWQDPANGKLLVAAIRDALIAADPADEAPFRTVSDRLLAKIDTTAVEVDRILGPVKGKPIVTAKPTMGWLAARSGFQVVGTVVPGLDGRVEVSTGRLTDLKAVIADRDVQTVFGESSLAPGAAEGLAKDAKVAFVGDGDALLGDTLGLAGGGTDTYTAALLHNAKELAAHA